MNKQEIEKAIDDLEDLKDCESISSSYFKEIHGKNLELAISVLEKQILKKPDNIKEIHNFRGDVIYKSGTCPICKTEFNSTFEYCYRCGQAIDWSVEE